MDRLRSLLGNGQRLDGGSMFGNAPRAVWERWALPDERHRIELACRSLLIEGDRTVLFEAGIGRCFPPDLCDRYGVQGDRHLLLDTLNGIEPDLIVLSHLHFDHAGGLLTPPDVQGPGILLFPDARYVVSEAALARAESPHPRDRASFLPHLQPALRAAGLEVVRGASSQLLGPDIRFHHSEGHTPGLLMAELKTGLGPMVFASDLIPGKPWIHAPITMGYDRFPERLIDEKTSLLEDLVERDGWVVFTHDPTIAAGKVARDSRGRFVLSETLGSLEGIEVQLSLPSAQLDTPL